MWLRFFKECMVFLIFLGINLLSLPRTFFSSQLNLWSAFQQCFAILFFSQSADRLCLSGCNFKERLGVKWMKCRVKYFYAYKKAKVHFKIHDVITWETNNYNAHTAQYLKKENQLIEYNLGQFCYAENEVAGIVPDIFFFSFSIFW